MNCESLAEHFLVDGLAFGLADFLNNHLFGGLRGNPAKFTGGNRLSVGNDLDLSGLGIKLGLNLLGGLDFPLSETLEVNGLAVFTVSSFSVFRLLITLKIACLGRP